MQQHWVHNLRHFAADVIESHVAATVLVGANARSLKNQQGRQGCQESPTKSKGVGAERAAKHELRQS